MNCGDNDNGDPVFLDLFEILCQAEDYSVPCVRRSRLARELMEIEKSPFADAFIEIMDNPKPFYDAWLEASQDPREAHLRLTNLPLAAGGGFGLKPEHFKVG